MGVRIPPALPLKTRGHVDTDGGAEEGPGVLPRVLVEFRRVSWPSRRGRDGLNQRRDRHGRRPRRRFSRWWTGPVVGRPTGPPVEGSCPETGTSCTRTRGTSTRWRRRSRERAKILGQEEAIGQILVPSEKVVELGRARSGSHAQKFFPGYMLVKMELTDDTWHLVKSTPKVTDSSARATGRRRCLGRRSTRSCTRWRTAPRSRSRSRSSRRATRCG